MNQVSTLQATGREKPNSGAFVFCFAGVATHLWWVIRTDLSKCVYSITYYTLYSWKYYTRAFIFHQECLITQPNTQLTTRHTLPFQLYPQFHNFNTQWENIGQGFQLLEGWTKIRCATHYPDEQCRCTWYTQDKTEKTNGGVCLVSTTQPERKRDIFQNPSGQVLQDSG